MAINDKIIVQEAAAGDDANPNIILDLNAGDVDSYDGDGDIWYDIHDFEYKPTTNVSEHFNTVIYTGNSSTNSITGVGFKPDLVWIKNRTKQAGHWLTDSVRGVSKGIMTQSTSAQINNLPELMSSFNSDGFTVGYISNDTTNISTSDYVAWCFKAGGAAVSNTDGTITSQVSANNDLGFSIVKYSGGNSSGTTVGHGLSSAPELIITKNTSRISSWPVFLTGGIAMNSSTFTLEGSSQYLALDNNTNFISYTFDSQFGGTANSGSSSQNIISYCFASKRGVSKVGSYTGNGSTNGPKIYTGFEPAFLMFKCTSQSGSWIIIDNKRATSNPRTPHLRANSTNAEDTGANEYVDFLSDGFQPKGVSNYNNNSSGQTYIYYAVAKNTNETSLIPDTDLELGLDAGTYSGSGDWLDSSGNGNNGTITGATWEEELGNSFEFDGSNDYINCGSASNIIPAGSGFTIETWVNANNNTTNTYWAVIGAVQSGTPYGGFMIYNHHNTDNWGIALNKSGTWTSLDSGVDIEVSKWVHLAYTYDGSYMKLFLDGEERFSSYQSGSLQYAGNVNFEIGRNTSTYSPVKVGQVRAYSSPLTQAQIRQNFNFTKPRYPNEFHGDITGATWNSGGYFTFDGSNDFVEIPLNLQNTAFSISFWAKDTLDSNNGYIISNSSGSTQAGWLIGGTNGGGTKYNLRINNGSSNYLLLDSGTVDDTVWHHVVVTWDNTTNANGAKIYINGSLSSQGTSTSTTNFSFTNSHTRLMCTFPSGLYHSNGLLSKVKFYNTEITQTEIDNLYNEGE